MDSFDEIFKNIDLIGKKKEDEIFRCSDIQSNYSKKIAKMLKSCQESIDVIDTGELIVAIPEKRWAMEQLISVICDQLGVIDLWCVVYAVSGDSVSRLNSAKKSGFIRNIRFVIDQRTKTWKPQNYNLLLGLCGEENLGCIQTHAKIFVCKQVDGDRIVSIIGSANLSKTPGRESMVIMTDSRVGDFLVSRIESWINEEIK